MRALLSALTIGVLASGSAVAADFGAPAPVVKGPLVAYYDWSGVYVGAHIGGGWEKTTYADQGGNVILTQAIGPFIGAAGLASDARASSFLGGAQIGWMYQVGRLVVGSEFDWSWTRLNGSGLDLYPPASPAVPDFAIEAYSTSTKWTATATTTIGIARDRWMLYSKLGAAWAHHGYDLNINGSAAGGPFAYTPASASDTRIGWTVGTGLKWAIADNWFLNVEYDYMDFGSKGENFSAVCTPPATGPFSHCSFAVQGGPLTNPVNFTPSFRQSISEVKVGLNYKFAPAFLFR